MYYYSALPHQRLGQPRPPTLPVGTAAVGLAAQPFLFLGRWRREAAWSVRRRRLGLAFGRNLIKFLKFFFSSSAAACVCVFFPRLR